MTRKQAAITDLPEVACTDRAAWRAWLSTAKRPETRRKRLGEAIRLLADGRALGMK